MSSKSIELMESAAAYAEQHKIFQLFEGLLQELVVNKPDKPLDFLIKVLKREAVPKVVVSGPPGGEARSLCELVCSKKPLVHVIASDVWRELSRVSSPSGLKAKGLIDQGKEVPSELMLEMLTEKLTMGDCVSKGWILEGFPLTASDARAMLAKGLLPTRFLSIKVEDAECVRRLAGRRIDPQSNEVYHLEDSPPPNQEVAGRLIQRSDDTKEKVAERLKAYRSSMSGVLPCFSKVLVELDGAIPGEAGAKKLCEAALPTITAEMPSRAPRGCPRVLLIGGPGSNAESLGAALATTYGAKHISAIALLHGAAVNGSKVAARAMSAPEPLVAAEKVVGEMVIDRLSQEDVRTAGFVLTGYPATSTQAAMLKKKGIWLRHVVHLELDPKDAKEKVCGTRYDPLDGEVYHISDPSPDEATAGRLATHPKDTEKSFKVALKTWQDSKAGLSKAYADLLLTESAKRPERELVELLAKCFLSL